MPTPTDAKNRVPDYASTLDSNATYIPGVSECGVSAYSQLLEDFYHRRFVPSVSVPAMMKTLAVVSSKFRIYNPIWMLNIAPSRHLKTAISDIQKELFPKGRIVELHSDFTILSLAKQYHDGKDLMQKCLMINDMTLLLASKSDRARQRLINGLAELASEGIYQYGDFSQTVTLCFRGCLIGNITTSSYLRNQNMLFENTFTNRCLRIFHEISPSEQSNANLNRESKNAEKPPSRFKQKVREADVEIGDEDKRQFNGRATIWAELGAYTSSSPVFDMIKSIAVAYAILSSETTITLQNHAFLDRVETHLANPFEKHSLKIMRLAKAGETPRGICGIVYPNADPEKKLPFIYETIRKYRQSGVLPSGAWEVKEAEQ